jgi:MinD-like ATPase involved in chromosome partitioning or flagellar assembly
MAREWAPQRQAADTVRVTVRSPDRSRDVQVPVAWTAERLIPELLSLFVDPGEAAEERWALGPLGGEPFSPTSTLADAGVVDGSILRLEPAARWDQAAAAAPLTIAPFDDGLRPQERTQAQLPRRQNALGRVNAALGQVTSRGLPALPQDSWDFEPGHAVPPAILMATGTGPLERFRAGWRESEYERQLDHAIQQPRLRRCVTIAVMSPKGGVGKTTLTALIGGLFAHLRRDRIVAVDSNPDFGSLGRCLTPTHDIFVDDVLEVIDSPELTATALDTHLGRALHGLMVLPAPTNPDRMARLDQEAYTRVLRKLQDLVGMVILDCGTGLHDPASRAALRLADQVVLVTDADPATASLVAEAAALIKREGVPIWLVVNKMPSVRSRLKLLALEDYVPFVRGLVVVATESRSAQRVAEGTFDWHDAPSSWRRSVRELAAVLAAAWPVLGATK